MRKRRRFAARALAAAVCAGTMGAGLVVGGSPPASAQVPPGREMVSGNFYAGPRDELFVYRPGKSPDELYTITKVSGQPQFNLVGSFTVDETYTPLVGDFDGDNFDEILWYAPGFAPDYMWNFTSYSSVDSLTYPVNGVYDRPVVGDFTADGADDILWYNPGFGADYFWDYNPGGGFTSRRADSNGDYLPVSGSIGFDQTDDIFWYAPDAAADYLWDYVPGSTAFESTRHMIIGTRYQPFSLDIWADGRGNEDIFWYGPGDTTDAIWDFYHDLRFDYALPNEGALAGHYLTTVGDYFGGGTEDVVFDGVGDVVLREHERTSEEFRIIEWVFPPPPETGDSDAGALSGVTPEKVETSMTPARMR
jgi:FG-GAP repeat